jgi:hypothetical protein
LKRIDGDWLTGNPLIRQSLHDLALVDNPAMYLPPMQNQILIAFLP